VTIPDPSFSRLSLFDPAISVISMWHRKDSLSYPNITGKRNMAEMLSSSFRLNGYEPALCGSGASGQFSPDSKRVSIYDQLEILRKLN